MTGVPFSFVPPQKAGRPYTVTEINEGVSLILESSNTMVWVEGEISNWKVASSGHSYFKLTDSESQVPAVMWRQALCRLDFEPEDGLAVLVIATIKVYRKAGYYQLDCHRMEPLGRGAQSIAFEKLKQRLEKEGLFDPAHKKPLPASIRSVGVVTSLSGAAIRDIVKVIASRSPQIDITIADVPVQGDGAAARIAQAIRDFNAVATVDCIIVGRGGGSAEDLSQFNEEVVARAVYDSMIPVISAVGHEIDFTICDFVADVRAPTPSAAAEMVAPDSRERERYLLACCQRFSGAFSRHVDIAAQRFFDLAHSRSLTLPLRRMLDHQQELDTAIDHFSRGLKRHFDRINERVSSSASRLNALSPLSVLARGFSAITDTDGHPITDAEALVPGQTVSMRFHKGSATATVTSISRGANPVQ